jgi:hypothetical protein
MRKHNNPTEKPSATRRAGRKGATPSVLVQARLAMLRRELAREGGCLLLGAGRCDRARWADLGLTLCQRDSLVERLAALGEARVELGRYGLMLVAIGRDAA